MAETSGFYDAEELLSGNYDREYVSEQFAQYFALFIGNGVFASPTNQLKVVAGEGMNIVVKGGWAFINGRWYHNDADLVIPVPPNTTAATINLGVFVHASKSDRDIHSILATGRTIPDREAPYYELKLAELQIPTGTTAVTDAMITDTRTDESVCGFVKGLLQGVIPTADLFAQYDAIFRNFYNHMKGQLDKDPAGHLQNEIDNNRTEVARLMGFQDFSQGDFDPKAQYQPGDRVIYAQDGDGVYSGFVFIKEHLGKWNWSDVIVADVLNLAEQLNGFKLVKTTEANKGTDPNTIYFCTE